MALATASPGLPALPVTKGHTYRLYRMESFDAVSHTLFCNAAVPRASSLDVLKYQHRVRST
jgi:hypothetical protein